MTTTRTASIERDHLADARTYLQQALSSRSNEIGRAKRLVKQLECVKALTEGWRWA